MGHDFGQRREEIRAYLVTSWLLRPWMERTMGRSFITALAAWRRPCHAAGHVARASMPPSQRLAEGPKLLDTEARISTPLQPGLGA